MLSSKTNIYTSTLEITFEQNIYISVNADFVEYPNFLPHKMNTWIGTSHIKGHLIPN